MKERIFIFMLPSKPKKHWVSQPHSSESEILGFKSWFDFCFQSQPRRTRAGNHEVSKTIICMSVSLGKETGPLPGSVQGVGKAECTSRVGMGGRTELHLPEVDTSTEQEMGMGDFNS